MLRRRPGEITAEGVRQWFTDLDDLARVGKELAGSRPLAETLSLESSGHARDDLVTPIVVVILIVAALPVFILCLGVILLALIGKMN